MRVCTGKIRKEFPGWQKDFLAYQKERRWIEVVILLLFISTYCQRVALSLDSVNCIFRRWGCSPAVLFLLSRKLQEGWDQGWGHWQRMDPNLSPWPFIPVWVTCIRLPLHTWGLSLHDNFPAFCSSFPWIFGSAKYRNVCSTETAAV